MESPMLTFFKCVFLLIVFGNNASHKAEYVRPRSIIFLNLDHLSERCRIKQNLIFRN